MELLIDLSKSLQENASDYFEKSKLAKKKQERIVEAIKLTEKKISELAEKKKEVAVEKKMIKRRKAEWFEKFRWFYTSAGFLVIGGRDRQSNELVVKKYLEEEDIYFHAEIHGAPHCVLKTEGKKVDEKSLEDAAVFAGTFSRAWKDHFSVVDVYSVKPEQVSKSAPSGEALGTGAFMIYGKRNWFKKVQLNVSVGLERMKSDSGAEYRVISGPKSSVQKHADFFVEISQGNKTAGKTAKEIKHLFSKKLNVLVDLDEIIRMLPSGGSAILYKKS